ncbi:hypothetical protein GGD46_002122 [Rhizobium lusitanum]|uniref:Uncharacterized protein n=1 Tax=Rhizobium lusitanum TaxID=293958 RepID=A0A7X0IQD3_9HYPH|nr:hypothetical protein [Rhizobium lusitanum]
MPRDNEELGRFLEARGRSNRNKSDVRKLRQPSGKRGAQTRAERFKDRVGLLAMLALLWGAHALMRSATRLFFRGFLSANQTRMLLRRAAWLNRKSLAILRRRQGRRLLNRYAETDNHDCGA